MASTLYVRNLRPNAVLVRLPSLNNLKYTVERRGSREDTVALPPEAREDPVVATFLQRGLLEEISKETFMTLASRPEETAGLPLKSRKAEEEVNIPIHNPEESRTPYLIEDKDLRASAKLRSPRPEFAGSVPTTEEDLAAIAAAQKAVEEAAGQINLPESETEQLRIQVNELTALVRDLVAKQAAAESVPDEAENPKTRKVTGSGTKKTRTRNAKPKS